MDGRGGQVPDNFNLGKRLGGSRVRHRDQLGELLEIRGGGSELELGTGTAGTMKLGAIEMKDAFEVRELHFDLLALVSRGPAVIAAGGIWQLFCNQPCRTVVVERAAEVQARWTQKGFLAPIGAIIGLKN